jgi:hypothetical protein
LPPTSQTTKLKIKTKPRAPFSAKYFRRREEKNNNENCVRLLLCCRLFLWCHRIIILLDGYQHSIVTTHTHTHTRTGSARDMHLLRDVEAKDSQRDTHTHTHTAPVKKTRNNSPVSNNLLAVSL